MQENTEYSESSKQIKSNVKDFVKAFKTVSANQNIDELIKLKESFSNLFKQPDDLRKLFDELSTDQCKVVCNQFKDELNGILIQKDHFSKFLFLLNEDKYQVVCEAFQQEINAHIRTVNDFDSFCGRSMSSTHHILYAVCKERLKEIIKGPKDIRPLLNRFNKDLIAEVCKDMPEIISNCAAGDFYELLKLHSHDKLIILFQQFENEINNAVKSSQDFKELIKSLSPDQKLYFYNYFKESFVNFVKKEQDLSNILENLKSPQQEELLGIFKEKLSQLVTKPMELNGVLKFLIPKICGKACDALKEQFKDLIKTGRDLGIVLKNLSSAQSTAVCHALKDHLKDVIKTGHDCGWILADLKPEQSVVVFDVLIDHFYGAVNTLADFNDLILKVNISERCLVFNAFEKRLSTMEMTSEDYRHVLTYLSPDEATKTRAYTILQERIDNIVATFDDLKNVLQAPLLDDQRDAICRALEKRLPEFFKSAKDLKKVLPLLSIETRRFVYDACKDIINVHYLKDISSLGTEQSQQIHQCWFNNIIQELPNPSGTKGQKHALVLRLALQKISDKFFNENYSDDGYKVFRQECQKEVNKARPHLRGWDDFFKRLALAILTVGTAPAIMAVYSKVTRDTYSFSFFAGKEEKAIDNFMENSVIAFRTCI